MTRIHDGTSWYAAYDAAGSERIEETMNLARQGQEYHKENLEETRIMIHDKFESDRDRWYDQRASRRAFILRQWDGNPSAIPSTWAKMVY